MQAVPKYQRAVKKQSLLFYYIYKVGTQIYVKYFLFGESVVVAGTYNSRT